MREAYRRCRQATVTGLVMVALCATSTPTASQSHADPDGAVQVLPFELPISPLLDDRSKAGQRDYHVYRPEFLALSKRYASPASENLEAVQAARDCTREAFLKTSVYKGLRDRYPVMITISTIGGVRVETYHPAAGIAPRNTSRVLINLHGGAFRFGWGYISHLESAPISALGAIKVVSVDYRVAPEHRFPAASEDVATVYRELLKSYKPENIGIFGCSAGGLLTAESIASFQQLGLPMPAAIGIFGAGAAGFESDKARIAAAIDGQAWI